MELYSEQYIATVISVSSDILVIYIRNNIVYID